MLPPDFLLHLPLLIGAGIIAGIMNTLAGGASLVTFPVLVALGLEARVANATNNLATSVLAVQAMRAFQKRGFGNTRLTWQLAVPSFLGAIVGAWGVIALSNQAFTRIVGLLMLMALGIVLYNPSKRTKAPEPGSTPAPDSADAFPSRASFIAGQLVFLLLGAYGGFFGGGIGMLILPVLVYFFRQDFLTGNSIKAGVVAIMNVTATVLFLYRGLVRFTYALPLLIGMTIGMWIGVHWAVKGGEKLIRPFLVVVTVIASIKFLFF